MNADRIARAAALIATARLAGRPLGPLPDADRPRDLAEAYEVQDVLHGLLTVAGRGPVTAHKIGCTTPVMQAFLGIPTPCAGEIFAPTIHRRSATIAVRDFARVGVECEIAVRLGEDLDGRAAWDRASVAPAVDGCMAAMEIVDDRYDDYTRLGTPTLVADDFFNAGCVIAEPVEDWRRLDLTGVAGRMLIDGELVGDGHGGDILGHPLDALAWLATHRASIGRPLRAGTFVLLGSVVATRWVAQGMVVRIEVDGLGAATATFT